MTMVGTPVFAAPEVMRGATYDQAVDVYSFGILLVNMAVREFGLVPFMLDRWQAAAEESEVPNLNSESFRRVMRSVWEDGWRPFSVNDPLPNAPLAINGLAIRCCAHDPSARPTFRVILEELSGACLEELQAGGYEPSLAVSADREGSVKGVNGSEFGETAGELRRLPKVGMGTGGGASKSPLPGLGFNGDDDVIKELVDGEGRTYFYNQETGKSGWERSDVAEVDSAEKAHERRKSEHTRRFSGLFLSQQGATAVRVSSIAKKSREEEARKRVGGEPSYRLSTHSTEI